MRKAHISFVISCLLSGCAAESDYSRAVMENAGAIQIGPSPLPDADYVMTLRGFRDLHFDTNEPATRERVVKEYMREQCPAARIVGESSLVTSKSIFGAENRTYSIKIRCR